LSSHEAATRVFEAARKISPFGAGIGALIGLIMGWPHKFLDDATGFYSYRNAFTQGEFKHVAEACAGAVAVLALIGAGLVYAAVGIYKSETAKKPPPP
jgi:hypothetical protein